MKILMIQNTSGDPSLALTKYLVETAKSIKSKAHVSEVKVITGEPKLEIIDVETLSAKGSPYSIKGNLLFLLSSIWLVLNLKKRYDVVHALYPSSSLVSAYLYKLIFRSKLVYEIRSPWVEMGINKNYSSSSSKLTRLFAYTLEGFAIYLADAYIFISQGLYDYYTSTFFPREKPVTIFPSATNFNVSSSFKDHKTRGLKMVHLGSLEGTRKIDELIRNFANLLEIFPDVSLDFIGDGDDYDNLVDLVESMDLDNNISFIGRVDPSEVKERLPTYDIGITHLPARKLFHFSSPIKNYEYLSFGLKLLLSEVRPNREFQELGYGKIYSYNRPEEFLSAYQKLSEVQLDKEEIRSFLAGHTYEANGEKIVQLYRKIY